MEKQKTVWMILCFVALFVVFVCDIADAYTLLGHRLIGGIRNRYYYLESSVTGYWSTPYYNAINAWYNTDTWHAFAKTYTRSDAQMILDLADDIYGCYGYTDYLNASSRVVNPAATDWSRCVVVLCSAELQDTDTQFDTAVATHELGHVCGLNENNTNRYSIMCQATNRLVFSPQIDDVNGLNYLYSDGYYTP